MTTENTQIILEFQVIKKNFNNYEIELKPGRNSLNISIRNKNNSIIYESDFNEDFLNKEFPNNTNNTPNNICDYISELIDQNQIQITENKNNLKIFLIDKGSFIELSLDISFKNLLEKIRECNEKIELMNKEKKLVLLIILILFILIILFSLIVIILHNNIKNKINNVDKTDIIRINERINEVEGNNNNIITDIQKKLNLLEENNNKNFTTIDEKINLLEKNNNIIITDIQDKINLFEENNNITNIEIKINNIINKLEGKKIQLTQTNLKHINSINEHSNNVNTIKYFPSGKIIAVDDDKSIIIYDTNFTVIQKIENAHDNWITYVDIKDENNFVTSSNSTNIKTWIKRNNHFVINHNIINAHNSIIYKVIYDSKGNLFSCSTDGTIKIWEEKNGEYENIKILYNYGIITSILLLEDKNILISSGYTTKFWDLNNNYTIIKTFENFYTYWNTGLERIDDDRIVVGSEEKAIIISISNQTIIHEINFDYRCDVLKSIENKGILFIGGVSNDIKIYRNDNYECIQTIENAHKDEINCITELKDGSIATCANENIINIWSL